MAPEDAGTFVSSQIAVIAEDIARAKDWLVQASGGNVRGMADDWIREQNFQADRQVDTESKDIQDLLANLARIDSLYLAFFQAVWELIAAGVLIPASSLTRWQPGLGYKTPRGGGPIPYSVGLSHPEKIERLPHVRIGPADPDIFLKGIDCRSLHPGVLEAVEQSLLCYRRGLFMPSTVMLAAAAEATWTECGLAVAKHLKDTKLEKLFNDSYASISKKVFELRSTLEGAGAKPLLNASGRRIAEVREAESWTTVLRDRRNALHWGKAGSFVADQSETANLLMASPLHIGTLEAIRKHC